MTHGAQNIVSEIDLEGDRSWHVAAGTQQSLNVTHIIHRTKDGMGGIDQSLCGRTAN